MSIVDIAKLLYHSPNEAQWLSSFAHNIWGVSLLILAVLILLYGIGYKKNKLKFLIPYYLISNALLFALSLFLNKGLTNAPLVAQLIFYYPHIAVHLGMVVTNLIGSVIEIAYLKGKIKNPFAPLAFPFIFIVFGCLLIAHPQGNIQDHSEMGFHSLLGLMFMLTGVFYLIDRLSDRVVYKKTSLVGGFLFLSIASVMLILYKEPITAYSYAFPAPPLKANEYVDSGNLAIIYLYQDRATPQNVKIKKGGQVKFILVDGSWHDMASGPHPQHTEYPPLNIGFLKKGETKTINFSEAGLHGFHDHIQENNQKLQGTILIAD